MTPSSPSASSTGSSVIGHIIEESMSSTMALFVPQWPTTTTTTTTTTADTTTSTSATTDDDKGNDNDGTGTNDGNNSDNDDGAGIITGSIGADEENKTNETPTNSINGTVNTMNGTSSHDDTSAATAAAVAAEGEERSSNEPPNQPQQQPPPPDDGGIELTHDPLTGGIRVSNSEDDGDDDDNNNNEDDDADRQCQLWSTTLQTSEDDDDDDDDDDISANTDGSVEITSASSAFGDIWSTEAFGFAQTTSPLKDLLDGNNFSLVELLEQDELLQELQCCEARLVEYFGKEEAVAGLVECLMVEVPSYGDDDGGGGVDDAGGSNNNKGKSAKERWCLEEEERRRRRKRELRAFRTADDQRQYPDVTPATSLEGVPSTVMDASSPKQDEPAVEARWNSPEKRSEWSSCGGVSSGRVMGEDVHGVDDDDDDDDDEEEEEEKRTPSEEYDLRFIRYPYMACEVLCSEVGTTLDVLVDGYVNDVIHDEEDSLLGDTCGGECEMKEVKMEEGYVDRIVNANDDINNNNNNNNNGGYPSQELGGGEERERSSHRFPTIPMTRSPPPPPVHPSVQLRPKPPAFVAPIQHRLHPRHPPSPQPAAAVAPSSQKQRRRVLDLLFSTLLRSPPATLDDRRAGYFEKLLNVLWRRRSQAMCDYMNTSELVTGDILGGVGGVGAAAASAAVDGSGGIAMRGTKPPRMPLASDGMEDGVGGGDGVYRDGVLECSSYISLSGGGRSTSYDDDGDVGKGISKLASPTDNVGEVDEDDEDKPPMLMCALFDHLHSYSIMHIVQRLLLPSPTRQQHQRQDDDVNSDDVENKDASPSEEGDTDDDNPNSAMNHQFMSTLNQMNNVGSTPDVDDDDDDDEEMDDDDPMNHIFQCTWSARPKAALELLLKRLEGHTGSFLTGYNYPVEYDVVRDGEKGKETRRREKEGEREEEASLLCSQHASEILITIIQNSALDSPVMRMLSSDPSLSRIIDLIVVAPPSSSNGDEERHPPSFVAHESIMTCAISVLESLVLQLGGYGAVDAAADDDAAATATTTAEEGGDPPTTRGGESSSSSSSLSELGPHTPPASPSASAGLPAENDATTSSSSNAAALARRVPALLAGLSALLSHRNARSWALAGAQYARRRRPIPLLGTSRLRILRLVESLVLLGDPSVDAALRESDVLRKALELFWQFEWCSMLHQTIANLLVHVFEGGKDRAGLQNYFLASGNDGGGGVGGCRLLERLMGSFGDDENARNLDGATVAAVGDGIDVLAIDDDDNITPEDTSEKEEDVTIAAGTGPRYGEMMMAMKTLYQSQENSGTPSSTQSDHGSDIEEDGIRHEDDAEKTGDEIVVDVDAEDANVAPVSEDDVDSVMEKECQESSEAMIGMTSEPSEDDMKESGDSLVPDDAPNTPREGSDRPNETIFRKGYMGHIIIICQALVHACNSAAPEETTDDLAAGGNNAMGAISEEPNARSLDSTSAEDEISTTCSFETTSAVVSPHPPSEQPRDDGETNGAASNTSKKRKERSPVRDGSHHDDLKRVASSPTEEEGDDDDDVEDCSANTFPIPNVQPVEDANLASPSPNDVTAVEEDSSSSAEQQPPKPPPPSPLGLELSGLSIGGILRRHPLHDRWQNFVVSVLAAEMSVQSTPLGGDGQGGQPPQQPTPQQQMQEIMASAIANSCDDGDLFRTHVEESSNDGDTEGGGSIVAVGEIVMDENDLDIAASMMEALSLPPSPNGGGGDGPPAGHSRRRGSLGGSSLMGNNVLAADGSSAEKDSSASSKNSSTGSNFGSVIQQHPSAGIGFKDYVYDDPLGGVHPFDSNSSSDEEEEEDKNQVDGFSKKNDHVEDDDNDGFMSDAMVVSREDGGDSTKQQHLGDDGSGMKKSGSNSSNSDAGTDDDDDDDDVPVLDMFVGSFEANFANFDAFDSSCSSSPTTATVTDKPNNNSGDPFEVGSGEVGDDDFFAAIDSSNTRGSVGITDDSKAEDDAALFEFAKTPFDLVDTLSSLDDDARNDNKAGATPTSSSFFMEGNNGNEKSS